MELNIFWTKFAQDELKEIYKYFKRKAGIKVSKKIVKEIYNAALILEKQPELGQIEELLKKRKEGFRYLVHKNYKLIYWINFEKNQVEITDVFDTRQNPPIIKRTK
ncbi:type II toxin-antitoxin system RelE/ParE family toxin [uncultured Polaribacter sp.]|uniref:type II toxin-antitoxin system RelE/ParE family toxin n=1 Tax=uncultured Polaribacter sp. TaxID=174711 RepID=UPI00261A4D51|nr:type II toxin-antitoxin system RelE/ParE family toxin [uncultured Polaribacter sp.]